MMMMIMITMIMSYVYDDSPDDDDDDHDDAIFPFFLSVVKQSFVSSALLAGKPYVYHAYPVYLSIHPSFYPSFYPSIHPSILLLIYPPTYLSVIPSIYSSIYLTFHPSFQSIHTSFYLSIGRTWLRTGGTADGSGCISLSTFPLEYVLLFLVREYSLRYRSSVCDE